MFSMEATEGSTGAQVPLRMNHLRSRSMPVTSLLNNDERVLPPHTIVTPMQTHQKPVDEMRTYRECMVLFGAFIANMMAFGWVTSSGYFFDYYHSHQYAGQSDFAMSWLSSLGFFCLYCVSLPLSKFCSTSTFGPRTVMFLGLFVEVLGLLLLPLTDKLYQLLILQAFLTPLGLSMVFNASITILSKWFRRKATLAISITSAGGGIGGLCFPFLINGCLNSIGYPRTMLVCAVIHLILLTVAYLTVIMPRGCYYQRARASILKPLKELQFMATAIGGALFLCGYYTILTFMVTVAHERGMSNPSAALAIANGCSVPGRLFAGALAKSRGLYNTLLIFTAIAWILTLVVFAHETSVVALYAYSASWGFFTGASISLLPAIIFQHSPPPEISVRIGLLYFIMSFGILFGPPVTASIPWGDDNRQAMIISLGVCQAIGWMFWMVARCYETGLPRVDIV